MYWSHVRVCLLASTGQYKELFLYEDSQYTICPGCTQGKMTLKSFPDSTSQAAMNFELIHSDLKELPVPLYHKYRYFIVFLDNQSGFMFTINLCQKSDTLEAMKNFVSGSSKAKPSNSGALMLGGSSKVLQSQADLILLALSLRPACLICNGVFGIIYLHSHHYLVPGSYYIILKLFVSLCVPSLPYILVKLCYPVGPDFL